MAEKVSSKAWSEFPDSAFTDKQFLALAQEGNSGAYALSKDHHDLLNIVSMGRMTEIASAFTNQVMGPFVKHNFGQNAAFPTFKFRSLVEADKERALDVWKEVVLKLGLPVEREILEAMQEKALQALDINPERASSEESVEAKPEDAPVVPTTSADPVLARATEALRTQIAGSWADDHVKNVAQFLESDLIGSYYPELASRRMSKYGHSEGWRRNRLRTDSNLTVDAMGLDSSRRGAKVGKDRPDLIILDDLDGEQDTPQTTEKLIKAITERR